MILRQLKGGKTSFPGSEFIVEGEGETKRPDVYTYSLTIFRRDDVA